MAYMSHNYKNKNLHRNDLVVKKAEPLPRGAAKAGRPKNLMCTKILLEFVHLI